MAQTDASPTDSFEDATTTYRLTCTDCSFEATVEGDVYEALDHADAHQEEYTDHPGNHFVNFTREG